MTYEIHTWTYCDGWSNNSQEYWKPLQFASLREVDENQTIEIVCDSKVGAEEYIKAKERFQYELNYITAELWSLADVRSVYKSKEK